MAYLTLSKTKKHLNIESSFTDDDSYIYDLIDVAEISVENHINQKLDDIATNNGGVLPSPLLHAMLLLLGGFYAVREHISFTGKAIEIPLNYRYLLAPYVNYLN